MIGSLDTNAVLAILLDDRPDQQLRVIKLLDEKGCYISDLVFPEVEYVLRVIYGATRQQIASNLGAVISHPNIKCNYALIIEVIDLYVNHPSLSFVDCCLAIEAGISKRTPLHTFDKKLASQSGKLATII